MNVQPIQMDRAAARAAFLEYKRSVRDRHDTETAAIMAGYRAIARGLAVIDVRQSIKRAGLNAQLLPLLAIARADALKVFYRSDTYRGARFSTKVNPRWPNSADFHPPSPRIFSFPAGELPVVKDDHSAFLPLIPVPLRPKAALSNYHLLWEAEWHPEPPRDPMLLRRLHGDLFAVVAHWNLTDLERAVMAGRIR